MRATATWLVLRRHGCAPDTGRLPDRPPAIFEIEKGEPPRRISVDELVAFATVFEVAVQDPLTPPALWYESEAVAVLLGTTKAQGGMAAAAKELSLAVQSAQALQEGSQERLFAQWEQTGITVDVILTTGVRDEVYDLYSCRIRTMLEPLDG